MSVKMLINQEHNGLELYFPEKPDRSVLTALSNAGWRYHRVKKCWYARHNDTNLAFAQKLTGSDPQRSPCQPDESGVFFPLMTLWTAFPSVALPMFPAGNRMTGIFGISTLMWK